jgi:hypothetical protein
MHVKGYNINIREDQPRQKRPATSGAGGCSRTGLMLLLVLGKAKVRIAGFGHGGDFGPGSNERLKTLALVPGLAVEKFYTFGKNGLFKRQGNILMSCISMRYIKWHAFCLHVNESKILSVWYRDLRTNEDLVK